MIDDYPSVFEISVPQDGRRWSTLDLVIGEVGLLRLATLLSGITGRLGREINPHALTVEEFAKRKKKRGHFITSVLDSPKLFVKGTERELEAMGQ